MYTSAYLAKLNYNALLVEILADLGGTRSAAGMVGSNRERLAGDGALVLPDGHVVVRVYEGGDRFQVFVLDDRSLDYKVIYSTPMLKSR